MGWRIQFKDPDKDGDKLKRKTIPAEWTTTEDLRLEYCVRESERARPGAPETCSGRKPEREPVPRGSRRVD